MITKCINWIKNSARRADEYYRAVTVWATSRRKNGNVKDLIRLGAAYEASLDKVLICLKRLRCSDAVDKEIRDTQDYKALVAADLKTLHNLE